MKILKYILIIGVLLTLYITEPLWRVQKTTEVSQIDAQMKKQQDERNNLTAEAAEKLRILEDKFGKKPDVAYKSRVPIPLQTHWSNIFKSSDYVYEDICSPLRASTKGWETTCQYKIRHEDGSSSGLRFDIYIIKNGKILK